MSGEEIQLDPIEPEEQIVPPPIVPQPAQEQVPVIVIDSDSESDPEEDPEEELLVEEINEALEANAEPEVIDVESDEEQDNHDMEDTLIQLGAMVNQLMDQNLGLTTRLQATENRAQYYEARLHELQVEFHNLNNIRDVEIQEQQWFEERVRILQAEVRACKGRINAMNQAYLTSMGHVQDAVWTYPPEIGQFSQSISRARVIAITENERVSTTTIGHT